MSEYTKAESQDWAKENLKGQWSTLVTPFRDDFSLDQEGLISNINHIRTLGTQGVGCTWGMGEFWSLSFEERLRIYDLVSDAAKGMLIGAHVSHTSLTEIRKLIDCTITIPKQGSIESLNVSMATGIVLSHIKKI